ncbi:MAG: helix-turn-helix transcriptional regulator [Acidimicrobiales bacterium]
METVIFQGQARALGDPTRYRLFRYIVEADRPVGVAELTNYVQLHHNAIRQHLAVLLEATLITDEVERRDTPGRPRLLYRIHPEVAGKWGTPGPYAWLAGLLGDALEQKLTPRKIGYQEGLKQGHGVAGVGDSADAMEQELIRSGFRPVRSERGRQIDYLLQRCPFEDVATDNPATVCQLHLGLAEGLAKGLGDVSVDRLTAKDPHRAGCRLVFNRLPAAKIRTRKTRTTI